MDKLVAKIITIVIFTVISPILCLIPWKFRKQILTENAQGINSKKLIVISILLCYGGGVLLATSLIHLLPEIRNGLKKSGVLKPSNDTDHHDDHHGHGHAAEAHKDEDHKSFEDFPLAETFLCLGFFLIYLIEEIVNTSCDKSKAFGHAHIHPETNLERKDSTPMENVTKSATSTSNIVRVLSSQKIEEDSDQTEGFGGIKDFLTVLALSTHAIFEGLAIGLEDSIEGVWTLFGAVAAHKFVISVCMGMELVMAKTSLKAFLIYTAMWVLTTPIGIGIGMGVSSLGSNSSGYLLTVGILQGLAAGTLVYVVVFEVLAREKSKSVSGMLQLLFVILGFTTLLIVELVTDHDH